MEQNYDDVFGVDRFKVQHNRGRMAENVTASRAIIMVQKNGKGLKSMQKPSTVYFSWTVRTVYPFPQNVHEKYTVHGFCIDFFAPHIDFGHALAHQLQSSASPQLSISSTVPSWPMHRA
jgi:hypothetical protein